MSETNYVICHTQTGKLYGGREWLGGLLLAIWLDDADADSAETWTSMNDAWAAVLRQHAEISTWDIIPVAVNHCAICDAICLQPKVLYDNHGGTYCGDTCLDQYQEYLREIREDMERVEGRGRL